MEPVVIRFKKFSINETKQPRCSVVASDITSIEECNLKGVDENGEREFDFVCICLRNGTSVNVTDPYAEVEQKWLDGLKLDHNVDFDFEWKNKQGEK